MIVVDMMDNNQRVYIYISTYQIEEKEVKKIKERVTLKNIRVVSFY